ncbi:granulocyte-macrophage colony-stimulating factor receptor subunit alpha-like isoform X1 [Ranitomeya imitator]|uniref:granulocyte-macrophage colony-stimulating factor receptor subunit alpha-like isoform X1 n=1 Tax=Ranitomeya imitator TaxID=111125 RepID=UPI0037E9980B
MVNSSCLVFLLFIWFPLKIVCNEENTTEEENTVPLLRDFSVNISPAFITIAWNCNITESMKKYNYYVIIGNEIYEYLTVTDCSYVYEVFHEMSLTLHKGVSVQLYVCNSMKEKVKSGKEETYLPEGKKYTAAENFSCVIYNVDIVNCSWSVGREAPEDTQYSLIFRQLSVYDKCQDYRYDSFGRQVGCVLRKPNISFKEKVYVEVTGLSTQTSVQFFDVVFSLIDDVILDPPRSITLTYKGDDLEIKWQKPKTHDDMQETCFFYNINITHKEETNSKGSEGNVYKITRFHPNEKATVTMRVKWLRRCSLNHEWSAWSKPQTIGDFFEFSVYHILTVVGVCTAIIISVFIFLCYRFKIWKKLFPQVPRPSMKLFDQVQQNGKSVQKESEMEIKFMEKDKEEFICTDVTEMPENL